MSVSSDISNEIREEVVNENEILDQSANNADENPIFGLETTEIVQDNEEEYLDENEEGGKLNIEINQESEEEREEQIPTKSTGEEFVNEESDDNDEDNEKAGVEDFEGFKRVEHSEKVMNDIFGDSDEEEDFEGFNENELESQTAPKPTDEVELVAEDADVPHLEGVKLEGSADIMQCFETVLERQRVERRQMRLKRRTDVDFLNDLDDRVADLMNRMRLAAVEDEELYHLGQPGIKKMQLLRAVRDLLKRSNIKEVLIESKFLNIMAAWLKALPNQVLPPLDIRRTMLQALRDFPSLSSDVLRESRIGKAVMYLLQHPRETPENKRIAKQLINEWSRNVFKLSSNYQGMTREERLERDRAISSRRKLVDQDAAPAKREMREMAREEAAAAAARPGEKNWIPRATMPRPSNKDYIVRPHWRVRGANGALGGTLKRERRRVDDVDDEDDDDFDDDEDEEDLMNRMRPSLQKRMKMGQKGNNNVNIFEKTYRRIKEAGKNTKSIQRAAKISIQGRGMHM